MQPMRLTAMAGDLPVVVVAFDATHGLCVFEDGHLEYIEHRDLRVEFFRDLEAIFWYDYGRQNGPTDPGPDDEVRPTGTQPPTGALPRADGRSDSDVAEQDS
jgi:hypothetical protein